MQKVGFNFIDRRVRGHRLTNSKGFTRVGWAAPQAGIVAMRLAQIE